MTLEELQKLRSFIDYPNTDSLAHRMAVRDFLVFLLDNEIERMMREEADREQHMLTPLQNTAQPAKPVTAPNVTAPQQSEKK